MKKTEITTDKRKAKIKTPTTAMKRLMFESNLHELYWCEKHLSELLPEFSKLATSYELGSAILAHLAVTENQIIRLIHVFDAIGERAVGNDCDAISNVIDVPKIRNSESGFERDTQIINSCQQIMDYEIKTYTQLQSYAIDLNEELAAEFLATAVKEERNTQRRLNDISLSAIYFDAAS